MNRKCDRGGEEERTSETDLAKASSMPPPLLGRAWEGWEDKGVGEKAGRRDERNGRV